MYLTLNDYFEFDLNIPGRSLFVQLGRRQMYAEIEDKRPQRPSKFAEIRRSDDAVQVWIGRLAVTLC
jgi:hypothetical protein